MIAKIAQHELRERDISPRRNLMEMCPMATMCKAMMSKRHSGFWVMLAGGMLIVLGMLTLVEPRVLVWLVGAAFTLFGIALLVFANFLRRQGTQVRNTGFGV